MSFVWRDKILKDVLIKIKFGEKKVWGPCSVGISEDLYFYHGYSNPLLSLDPLTPGPQLVKTQSQNTNAGSLKI